jgi:hypothetical protein
MPINKILAIALAQSTIFSVLSPVHKALIYAIDSLHDFTLNHLCNIRYLDPGRARS